MPPPGNKKRKTLAEKAGETLGPTLGLPTTRYVNTNIKGASLPGLARQSSFTSSRPSSSSSVRNASSSSYATSVSQGTRPPSEQSFRPHTAQSAHPIQKNRANTGRSTNSFDNVSMSGVPASGNSLSTTSFPTNSKRYPPQLSHHKSPRGSYDNQMNYTSDWSSSVSLTPKSLREISLSTRMSTLSLNSEKDFPLPIKDSSPQCSPSQIPKPTPKTPLPSRTPSPSKSRRKTGKFETYLTKESNTKTVVWDPEARLENIEKMYFDLKEKMTTTSTESSGLKESISMYKAKSGYNKQE